MITPWRRAIEYAVLVTLPSWLWGVVVLNVGVLAGSPSATDLGPDMTVGGGLLFVPVAVLVLTLVRRTLPALSRWRTATIDVSVYAVLHLLCVVATLLTAGSGPADAVDWAFVMMTAALLDLQFLLALALCAWRYDRLVPTAPANRLPHGPHMA
ncbi:MULTISPECIES: hypothetical protein [Streptomyces]|uniref:Flp pilus assembly pilin Flp n=1 Tax=Streptomyces stelliscabiei TaxID=146820 RepID=A0A8I0P9N8_9ACTN|nr:MULTISPECIES: hypothetical protein [Streptomyces]KND43987.1 hypothetical protein IQ64_15075 [Streptomyces stelliscabiei]MBE1598679.1 Flp pilus assembly pilin Flp [Streptomyces stelliscabiei]MDX2516529.1 hypothetical protein [Streptomyces stelliscabiei]MDX2553589.1 hypothetical protein [Streptomyces stelliscabiei]MDX2613435.1 hypothetical protein [Streptomyces stelliscabiei]